MLQQPWQRGSAVFSALGCSKKPRASPPHHHLPPLFCPPLLIDGIVVSGAWDVNGLLFSSGAMHFASWSSSRFLLLTFSHHLLDVSGRRVVYLTLLPIKHAKQRARERERERQLLLQGFHLVVRWRHCSWSTGETAGCRWSVRSDLDDLDEMVQPNVFRCFVASLKKDSRGRFSHNLVQKISTDCCL